MAYRKVCEAIHEAWDAVSAKWSADAKSKYFDLILLPLLSEANEMYQRNENLEYYVENCISNLRE